MNSSRGLFGMMLLPTLFSGKNTQKGKIECKSAEEEAEELQKIIAEEQKKSRSPEEIQEILMEKRAAQNRKPPQFQRVTMPIKMYTMFRPNDGF